MISFMFDFLHLKALLPSTMIFLIWSVKVSQVCMLSLLKFSYFSRILTTSDHSTCPTRMSTWPLVDRSKLTLTAPWQVQHSCAFLRSNFTERESAIVTSSNVAIMILHLHVNSWLKLEKLAWHVSSATMETISSKCNQLHSWDHRKSKIFQVLLENLKLILCSLLGTKSLHAHESLRSICPSGVIQTTFHHSTATFCLLNLTFRPTTLNLV